MAHTLLNGGLVRPRLIRSLLLVALAGCIATPQPNPPGLDVTRVGAFGRDMGAELVGEPGAISPADAELWVTPLDLALDPRVITPNADGSFATAIGAGRHRLQPRLGETRGAIVDVAIDVGLTVIEPTLPCLRADLEHAAPDVVVGGSGELDVELLNECEDDVTIAAAMRRPSDFEVIDLAPRLVEAGSTATVRVRFTPAAEGEREEILLVDVSGPAAERRWVTLYGAGTR